jgi:hypothetical protein
MTPDSAPMLLATASKVLTNSGFTVSTEQLPGTEADWVVAENDLFVLAVVAGVDVDHMRTLESIAVPELIERVTSNTESGGKRWDTYVVLVSPTDTASPDAIRHLRAIEANTRGARRLTALSARPTVEDVTRVLSPFVPIREAAESVLSDAHDELRAQLVLFGVNSAEADRAVDTYRKSGTLNDA